MFDSLRFIARHPFNQHHKVAAFKRYACWQLGSRLVPGPVAVPFVNNARLLVSPSMRGATGNIYTGLHEFEDMAFVLHLLRPGDTFVDVGANIGSYTILASGVVGAKSISFEPVPQTFARLQENIRLNDIDSLVTAMKIGVGDTNGVVKFTIKSDTVIHVATETDASDTIIEAPVKHLDDVAGDLNPTLIKIDVDGYETNVIMGGVRVFGDKGLVAVIMERNGQGAHYGFDEEALHKRMMDYGFKPFLYRPFERRLIGRNGHGVTSDNTLYVRDIDMTLQRLRTAPAFSIYGQEI